MPISNLDPDSDPDPDEKRMSQRLVQLAGQSCGAPDPACVLCILLKKQNPACLLFWSNLHEIFMNYPDFLHNFFYKLMRFGRIKSDGT
jgi:hypothetical protein